MKRKSLPALPSFDDVVLFEGWCVKESGTAFWGKTNWRRRWFRLVQRKGTSILQYFRSRNDGVPAGSVKLDITYCTRQVESTEKSHPNVFAVGPLVDDGSIRTYYISCSSQQAMQEWMTVVDAAIQGVPEQAHRRRETISRKFSHRKNNPNPCVVDNSYENDLVTVSLPSPSSPSFPSSPPFRTYSRTCSSANLPPPPSVEEEDAAWVSIDPSEMQHEDISDDELLDSLEDEVVEVGEEETCLQSTATGQEALCPDSNLTPSAKLALYDNQKWRMEHWSQLCQVVKTTKWKKVDTRDGLTIARCRFGRSSLGHAVVKVAGVLPAEPSMVYQFLQLSTKEGGKLDYIFRNETLLDEIESEPKGTVIFNQFHPPLPRISKRDLVAMKLWIPAYMTEDGKSGFVMFSVDHPEAPVPQESRRMHIDPSGVVLSPHPGPGGATHTEMVILIQVAVFGALHRMLKGAYNSGLLKLGLRTTFTHISEQLQRFVELVNM